MAIDSTVFLEETMLNISVFFTYKKNFGQDALGEEDDDYILFDCPGQIELYTHMNVMRRFVDVLQQWNFRYPHAVHVTVHAGLGRRNLSK